LDTIAITSNDTQINIPVQLEVTSKTELIPEISLSANLISKSVIKGDSIADSVMVSNIGTGYLIWSATNNSQWLKLGSMYDSLHGGETAPLFYTCNAKNISEGTHLDTITISSNDKNVTIPVNLTVSVEPVLAPEIVLSSDHISFSVSMGKSFTDSLIISNSGAGHLTCSATKNELWLELSPNFDSLDAAASGLLFILCNTGGLQEGMYSDTISIISNDPNDSLLKVTVDVSVTDTGVTHINNQLNEPGIIIYPNPASDKLYIEIVNKGYFEISVFSMNGNMLYFDLVQIQEKNPGAVEINTSAIPRGIYWISINGKQHQYVLPIVIE
jgi:hypothetical protein